MDIRHFDFTPSRRYDRHAVTGKAIQANVTDFADWAMAVPVRRVVAGLAGLDYAFCMLQGLAAWLFPCYASPSSQVFDLMGV